MPPQPGTPSNNPAGRPPGTPNRITQQIRNAILSGCLATLEQLPELLQSLEPKERIAALGTLLRFIAPTLRSIELTPDPDPDKYGDMSDEQRTARIAELLAKRNGTSEAIDGHKSP